MKQKEKASSLVPLSILKSDFIIVKIFLDICITVIQFRSNDDRDQEGNKMLKYILLFVLILQACIPQAVQGEATEEEKAAAEAEKLAAEEDAKESIAVDLTEDNFFDVVLNPKVNVLVMFYSRPTIWSKQYMPAYQNLAKIFKEESNCIVAKVNL